MMSVEPMAQKEKPYVVDYHRNSTRTMADRILRPESSLQRSAYWQCDSYSARHRGHPHCFTLVGDHVDLCFYGRGDQDSCLFYIRKREEISNVIHHHYRSNRTVFDWLLAIKPIN